MRISGHGKIAVLLAASPTLFAQHDAVPVESHNRSGVPGVREIVALSMAATQRHWRTRLHYSYVERDESRRRGLDGRVRSEDVDVSRTILVNGVPYEQLVQHNGRPPSSEEQRRQKAKLDSLKRETPEQRAELVRRREADNASLVREVPKAFDFQLVGEGTVNGRPAYILQAKPHPGYRAQGKYGRMFANVEGKLWVDKQELGWIKVEGRVIQPISMGLFLVRLLRGSQINMEQTRVDDGVWMPQRVEIRAAARIFFVKSLVIDRVLTYSEYKLAEVGLPGRDGSSP